MQKNNNNNNTSMSAAELVKSTFGFASAPIVPQLHSNPSITSTSTNRTSSNNSTPAKTISVSNNSSFSQLNEFNNDFNRQLSINENNNVNNEQKCQQQQQISPSSITSSSTTSSFCLNIPNTAKCIISYTAITEDEISLQKGDLVQIITANLHNRFLVHREATNLQPAAEGWIPGFVIGFKNNNNNNNSNASNISSNNNKVLNQ
jgi:hypothetical protein